MTTETITAVDYDAGYYGHRTKPKANYRNYGPQSDPHWAKPLARWLVAHTSGPWLDVGCAYGHLVREMNAAHPERVGRRLAARGIEWSDYAYTNRVAGTAITHGDARELTTHYPAGAFGTVVSLDFLEHLVPDEGGDVIGQMIALTGNAAAARHVHVIGAHNPDEDVSRHLEDPTHQNHEGLDWYIDQYAARGWEVDTDLTEQVRAVGAWRTTDWYGRMLVFKPAYDTIVQHEPASEYDGPTPDASEDAPPVDAPEPPPHTAAQNAATEGA